MTDKFIKMRAYGAFLKDRAGRIVRSAMTDFEVAINILMAKTQQVEKYHGIALTKGGKMWPAYYTELKNLQALKADFMRRWDRADGGKDNE